jgi:hypothetical protein
MLQEKETRNKPLARMTALATSALDRGSPTNSNTASAVGTNEFRRRRFACCASSRSSATSVSAAAWLAATTRATRPTRFMIVMPFRRVEGPAETGTRHHARRMVAGFWATKLSAHELSRNRVSTRSQQGDSSKGELKSSSVGVIRTSLSWPPGPPGKTSQTTLGEDCCNVSSAYDQIPKCSSI